jgi:hypothetical protein
MPQGTINDIVHPGFYHLRQTRPFSRGAMSYAWQRAYTDPYFTIYATQNLAGSFNAFPQNAPIPVPQAVTAAGLGGLVAGQWMLQPLLVPPGT